MYLLGTGESTLQEKSTCTYRVFAGWIEEYITKVITMYPLGNWVFAPSDPVLRMVTHLDHNFCHTGGCMACEKEFITNLLTGVHHSPATCWCALSNHGMPTFVSPVSRFVMFRYVRRVGGRKTSDGTFVVWSSCSYRVEIGLGLLCILLRDVIYQGKTSERQWEVDEQWMGGYTRRNGKWVQAGSQCWAANMECNRKEWIKHKGYLRSKCGPVTQMPRCWGIVVVWYSSRRGQELMLWITKNQSRCR